MSNTYIYIEYILYGNIRNCTKKYIIYIYKESPDYFYFIRDK